MSSENNLRVTSFNSSLANNDGKPVPGTERSHNLLYNCTQITAEEVRQLIESDSYDLDPRVIDLSDLQLRCLRNKEA